MGRNVRIKCGFCGNNFPAHIAFAVPNEDPSDMAAQKFRCWNCENEVLCTPGNVTFEDRPQERRER